MTGPPQFSLNAGVTRTFTLRGSWSMDWRLDATNVLNTVTYSGLNTIAGSPQFGSIKSSEIEGSNVDLSREFSNLVIMQRGYQASSQLVSTASDMLTALFGMMPK